MRDTSSNRKTLIDCLPLLPINENGRRKKNIRGIKISIRCIFNRHNWKVESEVNVFTTQILLDGKYRKRGILQLLKCKRCGIGGARIITASDIDYVNYDYVNAVIKSQQ